MKKYFFISVLFMTALASAKVTFNCYALNYAAQAYEAGRVNCATKETKPLNENTATTVTCMYQSICEALAPGEKASVLTPSDVTRLMTNGLVGTNFKMSAVTCRGSGIVRSGTLMSAECKAPKECLDDVLFNAVLATNAGPHENIKVDAPNMTKGVQK